ncbi:outer dynein arm-docking complex subunit 2 isoform X2 [Nematostella vectensis]|uniref:outer dynein arm-docking complex subunit 2 isoform X2 n=1 Tax=Nematostella vectensis TaxID=45351 RepID=UPI002077973F|nr:outer dynein arm-docking complex subunit 2 isoform X2 [Nematostella vectensis]
MSDAEIEMDAKVTADPKLDEGNDKSDQPNSFKQTTGEETNENTTEKTDQENERQNDNNLTETGGTIRQNDESPPNPDFDANRVESPKPSPRPTSGSHSAGQRGITDQNERSVERPGSAVGRNGPQGKSPSPQASPKPLKKEDSFMKKYLSGSEDDFESDEEKKTKPKNKPTRTAAPKRPVAKTTNKPPSKNDKNSPKKFAPKDNSKEKKDNVIIKRKQKLEPSLKWRTLNLLGNDESDGGSEDKKKQGTAKSKQSRRESRRQTMHSERGRSVATYPDTIYSESSTESEEEDDRVMDGKVNAADLPSEYWQIQRMVKFLKIGNPTATVICLCGLRDFNLSQEMCQMAIRDINGLQILINLLKTESDKCKIGSLKILQPLTTSSKYNRNAIINLGGVQLLVDLVTTGSQEVQGLAAATLANIAMASRARNILRRCGGIRKMVNLLNYQDKSWRKQKSQEQKNLDLEVARSAALALWSCSTSMRNRTSIFKAGSVPLLARLIRLEREDVLIPVVGLVQECAIETRYRTAFKNENMIEPIVQNLKTENQELQIYCANAIFKCAEDEDTRKVVHKYGGLETLVKLLSSHQNKKLLAAVTGAIWKCSVSVENTKRFLELDIVEALLRFLQDEHEEQPEQVQVHIVGALSELAKVQKGRLEILACKGCKTLVDLSTDPNEELVEQVGRAIAACSQDVECRGQFNRRDGLRLLWSLLKSNNPKVIASASWGIHGLMEDTPEAWENARSFVGGLELIVNMLESDDIERTRESR